MKVKTNLHRGIMLVLTLVMSLSSFAFDFTGKTFKGSRTEGKDKLTLTIRFMANHRASATMAITGEKTKSDSNFYWEISGDYINFYDSNGNPAYILIDWGKDYGEEWDVPQLDVLTPAGDVLVTLKYTPTTSSSSSKKKRK
ncbi:MAG: hypothetical protein K2N05_12200 [Muribaculaceae bacterium]|nr:hypothetical protein [Muribaculaceae bacterium]